MSVGAVRALVCGAVGVRAMRARGCPGRRATARRSSGSPSRTRGGAWSSTICRLRRWRWNLERGCVAAVITHRRPEETGPAIEALIEVARSVGARADLRSAPRPTSTGLQPATGVELGGEAPHDVDHLLRARRRRHDPERAAARTPAPACPCSASTSVRSGFWRRSSARTRARRSSAPSPASSMCWRCPGIAVRVADGDLDRDQRRLGRSASRASASRRSPTRSATMRSARPLRRPGGRHAGRIDGLQPRQRRSGDGLGRRGHGRLVHRAALVDRAGAGGRAGRHADDREPLATRRRSTSSLDGRPVVRARAGSRLEARFVDNQGLLAQLAGRELLQAPAGEVRAVGDAALSQRGR